MVWWQNLSFPDYLTELYRGYREIFPDIYPMIISSDLFLIELLDGSGYDKIFFGRDFANLDRGRSWSYLVAGRIYVRFSEDGSVIVRDRNYEEEFESKECASSEILRRLLILDEESKQ